MRRIGLRLVLCAELLVGGFILSCGGDHPFEICNCVPTASASDDYRHDAKHVPLPTGKPQETTIQTILSWPQGQALPANAPRSGRELQLFHVSRAYLQDARIVAGDCDVHFEVSQTPDKSAPRIIVETPSDSEYCTTRQALQSQLAKIGIKMPKGGELDSPLQISILGLAFQDFEHDRGSQLVATVWELHPAIVTISP